MARFFHLDRNSSLNSGQVLQLNPHDDTLGPDMRETFEALLPEGASNWGTSYLYDITDLAIPPGADLAKERELQQISFNHSVELVWELVRQRFFTGLPSRLQATFGYDDIEKAEDFRTSRAIAVSAPIWELEAEYSHAADAAWLTLTGTMPRTLKRAFSYWRGKMRPGSLPEQQEHLLWGKLTVLSRAR